MGASKFIINFVIFFNGGIHLFFLKYNGHSFLNFLIEFVLEKVKVQCKLDKKHQF